MMKMAKIATYAAAAALVLAAAGCAGVSGSDGIAPEESSDSVIVGNASKLVGHKWRMQTATTCRDKETCGRAVYALADVDLSVQDKTEVRMHTYEEDRGFLAFSQVGKGPSASLLMRRMSAAGKEQQKYACSYALNILRCENLDRTDHPASFTVLVSLSPGSLILWDAQLNSTGDTYSYTSEPLSP